MRNPIIAIALLGAIVGWCAPLAAQSNTAPIAPSPSGAKEKEKREAAPAQADSQQGFSYDFCLNLFSKAKTPEMSGDPRDAVIRRCMSTGKID